MYNLMSARSRNI